MQCRQRRQWITEASTLGHVINPNAGCRAAGLTQPPIIKVGHIEGKHPCANGYIWDPKHSKGITSLLLTTEAGVPKNSNRNILGICIREGEDCNGFPGSPSFPKNLSKPSGTLDRCAATLPESTYKVPQACVKYVLPSSGHCRSNHRMFGSEYTSPFFMQPT